MFTIKRLSECTFEQALQAWNEGFEGYYSNMTFTMDRYTKKLGAEGISPELSVIAFDGDKPVGFVLSGVRMIDGKKVAWNGGTGVTTAYRRKGVGKALMNATLGIYREVGVDLSTLEAISENEKAIDLYKQNGYEIIDQLVFYQREASFDQIPFQLNENRSYHIKTGIPIDVTKLSFYQSLAPWQTQWFSIQNGESVIIVDSSGEQIGYALFTRVFNPEEKKVAVILYQCEVKPERHDAQDIVRCALSHVFSPYDWEGKKMTFNISETNVFVIGVLKEEGFTLFTKQVNMRRLIETSK